MAIEPVFVIVTCQYLETHTIFMSLFRANERVLIIGRHYNESINECNHKLISGRESKSEYNGIYAKTPMKNDKYQSTCFNKRPNQSIPGSFKI